MPPPIASDDALRWAAAAFADTKIRSRYALYRTYSEGLQPVAYATAKYAQVFSRLFAAFAYNRCNTVVDAHADRLHVERFDVGQDDDLSTLAGDIWARNRMDKVAGEVHKDAFLCGDAYVIVWPDAQPGNGATAPFPTIWPQPPEAVRVRYDQEERPGRITLAARTWVDELSGQRHLNLYYADRLEKYVTTAKSAPLPATPSSYIPYLPGGEPWPVPNPWDTVPVFHFGNNAGTGRLGISELRDVLPLQDSLNKTVTDLLLATELVGFPQKVILGLDSGDAQVREGLMRLETGMNKIFTIPVAPGGVAPSINEFTAGNLLQVVSVAEYFDKTISRVSRVPIHYLQMSGDFPSGVALRTAETPFVNKIEDRQIAFGNIWEDVVALGLRQTGVAVIDELETIWKPAAPLSDEEQWGLALQKAAVGLPFDQILRELGYDEDAITAMVTEKDRRAALFDATLTGVGSAAADTQDQEEAPRAIA
jgi:hypothetical protein